MIFFAIFISSLIISLMALVGFFSLAVKEKILNQLLMPLVSFAAGTLLGGAFLHLLPEAVEIYPARIVFLPALVSFIFFYVIEKFLHWHHCHEHPCKTHSIATLNLVGDAIHNFTDGLVLAAAYLADFNLGLVTTLAIAAHEIPQEIGDFAILIYAKVPKKKAIFLNFLVALTVILGAMAGFFAQAHFSILEKCLLPFAAGGFIYIGSTDLVPAFKQENDKIRSLRSFFCFIGGIFLMYLLSNIETH